MNPLNLDDPDDVVATLAAAAETTTDADLREAYQCAATAIYSDSRAGWWPDDHPLLAALARHAHAHRGNPETGGLTHAQEGT